MTTKRNVPSGTVELFGSDAILRASILSTIQEVYETMGFDALQTPVLEFAETFCGHHGEGEELLFHLKDRQDEDLVLRYDLTVPLARFIANNPKAPIPFKRYQIATVFRDDIPDRGHFREFVQCDGDVIGISDLSADADVINLAYRGIKAFDIPLVIRVNHRLILKGISEGLGLDPMTDTVKIQRALDHIDKKKADDLLLEVEKQGLDKSIAPFIEKLINLEGTALQKLDELSQILGKTQGEKGVQELREILSYLSPEVLASVDIDLSLARGADYYTGFILEGVVPGMNIGAILGGGRYDNLVKALGGPDLSAVGMAFGLERLVAVCKEMGYLPPNANSDRTLVVSNDRSKNAALLQHTQDLRITGRADFIPMHGINDEAAIDYAKSRGFTTLILQEGKELKI